MCLMLYINTVVYCIWEYCMRKYILLTTQLRIVYLTQATLRLLFYFRYHWYLYFTYVFRTLDKRVRFVEIYTGCEPWYCGWMIFLLRWWLIICANTNVKEILDNSCIIIISFYYNESMITIFHTLMKSTCYII